MKFGYKCEIRSACTHSESEGAQFGSWSADYSNDFDYIAKISDGYPDICSTHDFQPGQPVFVVWVEYDSGDSFGWGNNSGTESVAVFADRNSAENLASAIREHGDQRGETKFHHACTDGQVIDIGFAPWSGFFERLSGVHVEKTTME